MKKNMVIGLGPDYNYPNDIKKWIGKNNTRYASNHGASFISRTMLKHFDAEYVDDFSNPPLLDEKYDRCIIAFATHLTTKRDVSYYAELIEKLRMPVFLFSLGIQDYVQDIEGEFVVHPSMRRLLQIVSERSVEIGCRGPITAEILQRAGIRNVRPVGCPTLFYNCDRNFQLIKKDYRDPAVVFHRTFGIQQNLALMQDLPLVGQDFLDEVIFVSHPETDQVLRKQELAEFDKQPGGQLALDLIYQQGKFFFNYDEWASFLETRGFVFGPRLHGCIMGIVKGIPAVMTARDMRIRELSGFFKIPCLSYDELPQFQSPKALYDWADYSQFNQCYAEKFDNYNQLLIRNGFPPIGECR
jgi:hypothetical protein